MILKLTDFSKLLISYSFSIQYCRVLGHAITTKPLWQENSFRRVPSGDIPRPGLSLSLLHRECLCSAWLPRGCSCLTALQHCRAQRSWGGRRAAQETEKGFCQLLHTPAQYPVHSESLCWGTAALMASSSLSRKGSSLVLVSPSGHLACIWVWQVTLQKDATGE